MNLEKQAAEKKGREKRRNKGRQGEMKMMGPEDSEETHLTGIENWVEELWEISKVYYSSRRFESQAGTINSKCWATRSNWRIDELLFGKISLVAAFCVDGTKGAEAELKQREHLWAFYPSPSALGCQTCPFKYLSPIILPLLYGDVTFIQVKEIVRVKHFSLNPSTHVFETP